MMIVYSDAMEYVLFAAIVELYGASYLLTKLKVLMLAIAIGHIYILRWELMIS